MVAGVTVVIPSLQLKKASLYSGWGESGLSWQRSILQLENPLWRPGQPLGTMGTFGVGSGLVLGSDDHFWMAFLGGLAEEPQLSSRRAGLAKHKRAAVTLASEQEQWPLDSSMVAGVVLCVKG